MIITNKGKRKRFLAAATALSIGVTLCAGPMLGACGAEHVNFSGTSLQADAGKQIEVTVSAEENTGIAAYGVTVSYDADCFAPVSVKNHWNTGSMQDSISTAADDSFDIYWYASDNCKKNGEVFTIVFDVLTTASEGEHTIAYNVDQASTFAIVENEFVSVNTAWSDTVVQVTNSNPSDGTDNEEKTDMPILKADAVHTKKKKPTVIPFQLKNPFMLKGISLEMKFDPTAVEKDSIEIALGGELQNANQSFNVNYETGTIRYSMYADPIASDCVLLEMTLVPLKAFELTADYIPQSTYDQNYELIGLQCMPVTVDFDVPETKPATTETTTTTSKSTTTTSKATTTTSKATTTTSEAATTTSEATSTTEETTDTTESTTSIVRYRYSVKTVTNAFFYAHDTNPFSADGLVDSVTRYAVYNNGLTDTVGEKVTQDIAISFGDLSPAALYDADENKYSYVLDIVVTDEFGEYRIKDGATVYIGVKGDVNLDGSANSIDAAQILTYAAELGAGKEAYLYTSLDEKLENFAYFLADIDGESRTQDPLSPVNAVDAASILVYAALVGSGEKITWEELLAS